MKKQREKVYRRRMHKLVVGPIERVPTEREIEIAQCVCDGLSTREIAEKLDIAVKTVEAHRANLYKKLGVRNSAQCIQVCVARKIVKGLKVA